MMPPADRPQVTVLMPTWNRLPYLPEAVESVLAQTLPDLELLVIDDGSTDQSLDWLKGRANGDSRLRPLSQAHAGISSALNHGLAAARGTWIARLDSDDAWHPDFLSQQMRLAAQHPEAHAIYSRAEAANDQLEPKGYLRGTPPVMPDDPLGSLLLGDFTCNITVVARRKDIADVGGWREQFPHGEDWDLWLRIARLGPFHFNPAVLARYREHGDNITQQCWHDMPEVRAEILKAHFADPDFPSSALRWRGTAFRRQHVNGAMAAISTGHWRQGFTRLRNAFNEGDGCLKTLGYTLVQGVAWIVVPRFPSVAKFHRRLLRYRDRRRSKRGVQT